MFDKILSSIKALIRGFLTVCFHLIRKPVTQEYPEIKPNLSDRFRGKHSLHNCMGCGYCQKVCPSDAITIIKKDNKLDKYIIDFKRCIFCGNCLYYCPVNSMNMTNEFELAESDKSKLKVEIENRR